MAKKSLIIKCAREQEKCAKGQSFSTRSYTRCQCCGRPRGVYKKFMLCRICFREMAQKGHIPGVTKASW